MDETQEQQRKSAEARKKRTRKKSYVLQLQAALDDAARAEERGLDISGKKLLQSRIDALVLLAAEERGAVKEKNDKAARETVEQLNEQHAADQERIDSLTVENVELQKQSNRVQTVTVPDPEHEKTRRECETLRSVVNFLTANVGHKEQTAIRAIQELPAVVASIICDGGGLHYNEYALWLRTYPTFRQLSDVIEKATSVDDSPLLRFCRTSLAVNHQVALPEPRSRLTPCKEKVEMLTAEEKITQAKKATGTLKNHPEPAVIGDFRPRVTQ